MLEIILFVAIGVAAFALIKKILVFGGKGIIALLGAALLVFFGIPAILGYGVEKVAKFLRLRLVLAVLFLVCMALLSLVAAIEGVNYLVAWELNSLKWILPVVAAAFLLVQHRKRHKAQRFSEKIRLFEKMDSDLFAWFYVGGAAFVFSLSFEAQGGEWAGAVGWAGCVLVFLGFCVLFSLESACKKYIFDFHGFFSELNKINSDEILNKYKNLKDFAPEKVEALYFGVLMPFLKCQKLIEVDLRGCSWLFKMSWYQGALNAISDDLSRNIKSERAVAVEIVVKHLCVDIEDAADFLERHIEFGDNCQFEDGDYFVHFENYDKVKSCACCGVTVEIPCHEDEGEWFCSPVCEEVEANCYNALNGKKESQVIEYGTSGAMVMAGTDAWVSNHKIFAAGGQGHGFAAEQANTKIDLLSGKNAKVVGDDNALNGADRIVDKFEIQTKYCKTAARSVGAGFDGQDGSYRYVNQDGQVMQLEVPKDQYQTAVKMMREKIKNGKVPGVVNPDDAEKIVRKGNLTYDQARNITKFGTVESVAYDLSEGVIVGLQVGGISFGLTAFVSYLNTKDVNEALRVALIQGSKTAVRTTAIYVGAQQLHRIGGVQSMLQVIDAQVLSPSSCKFLQNGFGVTNKAGLTKAMRGTVVTSVVVIAITTGPDLIKLIRGRISGAQFLKNIAVVSTSVVGGVAGSIVGGAAGAALGPVGMVAGRVVGGVIGGYAAGYIANKVAGVMMKEDREVIIEIIQRQVEYLARTFILTKDELDEFTMRLNGSVDQKYLEDVFASVNRRAQVNALLKPIVVGITGSRPALKFKMEDVVDACVEVAA